MARECRRIRKPKNLPQGHPYGSMSIVCKSELHQTGIRHFLQAHENTKLGVEPGQAALEIDRIGRADGTIGGKLNGAALDEGTGGHNYLILVAGHVPGEGVGIGIHRGGGLNPLAEGNRSEERRVGKEC